MANNNVKKGAPQTEEQPISATEAFFVKYKKAIIAAVVAVIVIIVGIVLYNSHVKVPREIKASTALSKGQVLYSAQLYDLALNGDSLSYGGFLGVIKEYGNTEAGNLANLYAGLCYAQLEQWDNAVKYLEEYDTKGDKMISPAAEGALGNAYAHLNQLDKAVSHLKSAAQKADNNSLSPIFLIQAGEILESQGDKTGALSLYEEIKAKYYNSLQYQTIDKYIERVKE